jgi:hypothetical protein
MKRITLALGLLSAGLTGCASVDSRVAFRGDIVSESGPVMNDRESSPPPLPIVVRWQRLMVKIRESARHPHGRTEEIDQGPVLVSVSAPATHRVGSDEENSTPRVVHSGGIDHHERVKTLPNATTVVQAGASQPALPSEPMPTAPAAETPDAAAAASENATEKPADGSDPQPGKPHVRAVNSKRIVVDYEIKDIGPSGISTVDLWYTRDGRRWEKCPVGAQRTSPYILEVKEEGMYGMTLVASSGVGLKKRPPRPGDSPQIWIEVDTTKPLVRLTGCTVGTGAEADSMTIAWKATDKHLGEKPITLSYAEQAEGPWSTIVANVENTGSYVWKMPTSVPQRLVVRMEATDLAGNVGITQTRQPVLVDLAKPSVSILSIKPAAN